MSWLKGLLHDFIGHPVGLKHGGACNLCSTRSVAFCTDCGEHYTIDHPPITGMR